MKKLILIAALVCCVVMSVNAQMKVYNYGAVRIGIDPLEADGMGEMEGNMDSTTMLRVWGHPGEICNARMSFGFHKYKNNKAVMVGQAYNEDNPISEMLWLHGKKGFCATINPQATDTIISYNPYLDNAINFALPVQSPSFLVTSDARLKEDVQPVEESLDALSALSSVTYRLKAKETPDYAVDAATEALLAKEGFDSGNDFFRDYYNERSKGETHYGFIAQQVQEVLPELVHTDKDGMLSVDYIGVIPLLVNAIQELKGRLEQVEAEKEMATPAVNHAPAVTATADVLAAPAAEVLSQNDPNPFSSDTRIAYNLPEGTQQAAIYIYDLQGKQVKRLDVSPSETGTMLHGGDLQAGMYIYSLIADGKELASKKMILTK